jgi:hypothetical protein
MVRKVREKQMVGEMYENPHLGSLLVATDGSEIADRAFDFDRFL